MVIARHAEKSEEVKAAAEAYKIELASDPAILAVYLSMRE